MQKKQLFKSDNPAARVPSAWFPLAALSVAMIASTQAFAQEKAASEPVPEEDITELEPLTVTGDLLLERADRLPGSLTLVSASELSAAGQMHFQDVLHRVPNLNWAGGTSRPRFFQIRGIGENSQFGNEVPASSVGFIIDGIDFTGMGTVASLFDIDQVEVLRGPQTAAFGANAMAGMILLKSTDPTPYFTGTVEGEVGNHDLYRFGAALGGPIIPGRNGDAVLSFRVSAEQLYHNGYRDNAFLDREDTNERDETSSRLKLRFQPSQALSIDLTAFYADFDNGYDAWSLDNNSFETTTDEPGQDSQETKALALQATLGLSETIDLVYLGSVSDSDIVYSYDWDWSNPAELMELYGPEVYYGIDRTDRERFIHTHDLRLRSLTDTTDSGLRSWATGLYLKDFEEEQVYFDVDSAYDTQSLAAYGQLEWGFNEALSLDLGARLEDTSIDYQDEFGTSLSNDETLWGGKIALKWLPRDQDLLYINLDRGYKVGGVNLDDDVPEEYRVYDTETLWNASIGWRATRSDGRFVSNLTVFYMDREDIQVDTSIQTGDGNTFALFKDNAASGTNYGLEWDLTWYITQNWRVFGSLGWLQAEFDDYSYVDPSDGVTVIDLSGSEQAYAPEYNYRVGTAFDWDNGFFAEVSLYGRDHYVFDLSSESRIGAYDLIDLRLGYRLEDWTFTLWVNNVTDETYDVRGFYFANEPPLYDTPKVWLSQGDPRQVGFTVRYEF